MSEAPKSPAARPDAGGATGIAPGDGVIRSPGPDHDLIMSLALAACCGIAAGVAGAFFLTALDAVTSLRWRFPWLLCLLPVAGVATVEAYRACGRGAERGTALVLDAVRDPGIRVPGVLAPMILGATLLSHLCGGSVGREGTAVQMGASLGETIRRRFFAAANDPAAALLAGVAGGFGAVFGTPWAGALYAVELPLVAGFRWSQAIPCLVASWCGHATCTVLGVRHTPYPGLPMGDPLDGSRILGWVTAGLVFGLAARSFVACLRGWGRAYGRLPGAHGRLSGWIRPVAAAGAVIAMAALLGTDAYLGLGVTGRLPTDPSIVRSFDPGGVTTWSWFWKLLFTTATLAGGFKGGEVTPIFFIGAALGQTVATLAGWPVGEFAALGFIAVFAAAGHTPWTCAVLGWELFGPGIIIPGLVAVLVADAVATGAGLHAHRTRSALVDRVARWWTARPARRTGPRDP